MVSFNSKKDRMRTRKVLELKRIKHEKVKKILKEKFETKQHVGTIILKDGTKQEILIRKKTEIYELK